MKNTVNQDFLPLNPKKLNQLSQNPNAANISHGLPVPDAIYARSDYPTVSALLEAVEQDNSELDHWDKTSHVFLLPLLNHWQRSGRPEIKWPTLPGLPSADSGECILEAYLISTQIPR
jgi:hypothetical protein